MKATAYHLTTLKGVPMRKIFATLKLYDNNGMQWIDRSRERNYLHLHAQRHMIKGSDVIFLPNALCCT